MSSKTNLAETSITGEPLSNGEWASYKRQVFEILGNLKDGVEEIRKEQVKHAIAIAVLQTKAGLIGAAAGAIAAAFISWLMKKIP